MTKGREEMPSKKQGKEAEASTELLRDPLITEPARAGVPQLEIRKIVGCDIHKVSRIAERTKQGEEQ
jgi:hypothetical protein